MGKFKGAFLIALMLCSTILLFNNPFQGSSGVLAYYDDVKGTSGCSIYAPAQAQVQSLTQADTLTITGNGTITNNGVDFNDLSLLNSNATAQLKITDIKVGFTNPQNNQKLKQIDFSGIVFFNGSVAPNSSGFADATGTFALNGGAHTIMHMNFEKNAKNERPFTLIFTMGDASTKTMVINPTA